MNKESKPTKSNKTSAGHNKETSQAEPASSDSFTLNTRIIEMLQEDGRTPYSTIASALGVSEGTVRNRVKQLLDDNVITIQAEALPSAFGYNFNALTFIKVASGTDIDSVADRLTEIEEVYYLIMTLGRYDLGVASYHKNHDDYREFLKQHCYGQNDIGSIETNLVLNVHKMKLQWKLF